jgi:hypothetical protein
MDVDDGDDDLYDDDSVQSSSSSSSSSSNSKHVKQKQLSEKQVQFNPDCFTSKFSEATIDLEQTHAYELVFARARHSSRGSTLNALSFDVFTSHSSKPVSFIGVVYQGTNGTAASDIKTQYSWHASTTLETVRSPHHQEGAMPPHIRCRLVQGGASSAFGRKHQYGISNGIGLNNNGLSFLLYMHHGRKKNKMHADVVFSTPRDVTITRIECRTPLAWCAPVINPVCKPPSSVGPIAIRVLEQTFVTHLRSNEKK